MGNLLYIIALTVRPVVHGVNTPFVGRAVMALVHNAINNGVSHEHIRRTHINFCAQYMGSFGVISGFHFSKKLEIFVYCSTSKRAGGSGLGGGSFLKGNGFCALRIDISKAFFNQHFGPPVQLIEIIRGITFVGPRKAKPTNVFFDGVYILLLFFARVGIVKS